MRIKSLKILFKFEFLLFIFFSPFPFQKSLYSISVNKENNNLVLPSDRAIPSVENPSVEVDENPPSKKEKFIKADAYQLAYRFPVFNKETESYVFEDRFIINEGDISKHSYYYKVFYYNNRIEKVEYYYLSTLTEVYEYTYDQKKLIIRGFNENQELFFLQHYDNGKLTFFEIYDDRNYKTYTIQQKNKSDVLEYCFFLKTKESLIVYDKLLDSKKNSLLYTCMEFNKYKQIVSSREYANGILNRKFFYQYDNLHRLKKESIHYIQERYNDINLFFYKKQYPFLINKKKNYRKKYLFSNQVYNLKGQLILKTDYFPYSKRIQTQVKYQYKTNESKELNYYDFLNALYAKEIYDKKNHLIYEIHYPSKIFNIKEKNEYNYAYNYSKDTLNEPKLEIIAYKNKKIFSKSIKNKKNQLLEKLMWDSEDKQTRYLYIYDDQHILKGVFIYIDFSNLIERREYSYYSNALKLIEFFKIENKKIAKKLSEHYEYYPNGYLKVIKYFEEDQLVELKRYDFRSRVIQIEYGSSGEYHFMVKHVYDAKDLLIESVRYNKINQIEGYIHYSYNDFNLKTRQDIYDDQKKYLGSVEYRYDNHMILTTKLYYDAEANLYKEENV